MIHTKFKHVEKVQHKDIDNRVEFFCGDETMYFNKQQKFY